MGKAAQGCFPEIRISYFPLKGTLVKGFAQTLERPAEKIAPCLPQVGRFSPDLNPAAAYCILHAVEREKPECGAPLGVVNEDRDESRPGEVGHEPSAAVCVSLQLGKSCHVGHAG